MDSVRPGPDDGWMAKQAPPAHPPVYLAEWLTRLDVRPVELAKAGLLSEGYVSLLRSGKRVNPRPALLMKIGEFLGITWTNLYRPPPSPSTIAEVEELDPRTLDRLRKRQRG